MLDLALPFKESDLLSFGGLVALLPALAIGLGYFVKLKPDRMHLVILFLSYAIGMGVKATVKTAYTGVSWIGMAVALFLTAIAACQAFDTASGNLPQKTGVAAGPPPSLGDSGPKTS